MILPVYLWFWARSERYWGVWQTGQQRSERALNHEMTTKSPKPEFRPSLRPSNARIFVQKTPVFRPSFYKNEPVWRIGNTGIAQCDNGQRSMMIVFRWSMSALLNTIWNIYVCSKMGKSNLFDNFLQLSIILETFYHFNYFYEHNDWMSGKVQKWSGKSPDLA